MDEGQGELVTSSDVVGSPNAAKLAHELQKDSETPMTRGDQNETGTLVLFNLAHLMISGLSLLL